MDRIEHGRVSVTATVERMLNALGYRLVVDYAPLHDAPLTREDRRSLALHRAVAAKLLDVADPVLCAARGNLTTMRAADTTRRSHPYLDAWERLLDGPEHELLAGLLDPAEASCALRQNSPFAGTLTEGERAAALAQDRADASRPA